MFAFNQPLFVQIDQRMSELLIGNETIILFHYLAEPIVYILVCLGLVIYFSTVRKDHRAALFIVLVIAVGNGINRLVKNLIERPRPERLEQLTSFSFPSGHAMMGLIVFFTVAYFITRNEKNRMFNWIIWIVTILLVIFIGLSRIAESRHYATDVFAGWCLGYTWFVVCILWYKRKERKLKALR